MYISGVVSKVKDIINIIVKNIEKLFDALVNIIMDFFSGIIKKIAIYGLIAGCFVIVLLVIYCM